MSDTPLSQQSQQRDADVVSRHLPEGFTAGPDALVSDNGPSASAPNLLQPSEQDSLTLQGGDIHRDIFKIEAKGRRAALHKRAATFAAPNDFPTESSLGLSAAEQQAPGGFRRQHLLQRQGSQFAVVAKRIPDSFISFLDLYGSFAGEDLAEWEEAVDDEEEGQPTESAPLLGRGGRPISRRMSSRMQRQGDAGMVKSFFTLLKAFIGTGILFLPKAFKNGGILFSSITLVTVSVLTTLCFNLLLACRKRYGGGYGEIGEAIGGPWFRRIILTSIFISQIGFVCAGLIFTAENMYSFLEAVTRGKTHLSATILIALEVLLVIPLGLIRNISKLGFTALFADVCILIGLTYIWWYTISSLSTSGIHPTVELFNPKDFTLTVGSAIFTFEGIGLILPIQSSMAQPQKFDRLLYLVMIIITVIFGSVGVLCYATFGDVTRVEIITNFPQTSKLVNAVQFLYSMAVLVGAPVQLFPAVRIIETSLFGEKSGKGNAMTKWKKNAFRAGLAITCGLIAIVGASDLDKFVALIGSFACVPLVYIYPALLHLKGVARSQWAKAGDILMMIVGVVAMVYTTAITVMKWSQ